MSTSNHIQFLDGNLLTTTGSTVNTTTPPVSSLYEGAPNQTPTPVTSTTLSSLSIDLRDGTTYSGAAQLFAVAPVAAVAPAVDVPPSNVVVTLSADIDEGDDTAFIVLDKSSSAFGSARRWYGWQVSPRVFYAYLPDDVVSTAWSLVFTGQSSPIMMSDIFFGSAVDLSTGVSKGLSHQVIDPSVITYADSGRAYAVRKALYQTVNNIRLSYLRRHQIRELKLFSERKGVTEPFWAVMDPENHWDGPSFGATYGAYTFTSMPRFTHDFLDRFTAGFDLREAL